ncbi:MAG: DUF11 domain-containing protein [Solirubrobacteraceae bacterium]|nr:DUF11 domain-containing protein [Solirubrobacteraceae bacterium]
MRLLLVVVAALASAVLVPAAAHADGTPNISLAIDAQDNVLYGKPSTVRLTTTNPPGSTGYALSYRVVLPTGVSYVASSAGAAAGEPTVVANQPVANQTTLLWKNVADVGPSTGHVLEFQVQHAPLSYVVGAIFSINASAYVASDDRYPPQFTAAGQADSGVANPYTGFSANKTDTTRIAALEVEKTTDGTPEDELLRGVHDRQTIYTVTVRNNTVAATTGVIVDDYLPAGLEFIGGCGNVGVDHTTNAPTNSGSPQEYPGAGAIPVVAVPGCVVPNVVETVSVDPAGPAPSGVYTHVRWSSLGTLAAGATLTLKYRAAVPLRANTTTWVGGLPSTTTGLQAANLNNNSGAETADEATITSYTRAQGDYNDAVFTTADGSVTRTIEDVAVRKTAVAPKILRQGDENQWEITVSTSEYRSAADVDVTDTVPDGLCPLSSVNHTQGPQDASDLADCAAGPDPSDPYASVTENSSGTFTVRWNGTSVPALLEMEPSTDLVLTYATRARLFYQDAFADDTPVLSRDTVTNAVAVAANARVICSGGAACPPGPPSGTEIANPGTLTFAVTDASSDEISAEAPTLDKQVADTSTNCSTATYTDGSPAPSYRPGDRICWLLRVEYPMALDTGGTTVLDYLPPSLTLDTAFGPGGTQPTGNDTIAGATLDASTAIPGPGGLLEWTLPTAYVDDSQVFEHRIATRAGLLPGAALGDVTNNLLRSTTQSTSGATLPLRDEAPYRLSMPVMSTTKRVTALDGTPVGGAAGVATQVVRGGQTVAYRVRLANTGDQTAEQTEAWDRLPAGVTCADVTASGQPISDAGVCDGNIIKWGATPAIGPDVAAGATKDLTYAFVVPTTIEPTQALTGAAGIRRFQTPTNTGGTFTYIPGSNVDPAQDPSANMVSPTSSASITGAVPTITKTRDTSITESNLGIDWNSTATATIGETIHYEVSATVPAGVTVRDFDVTDVIEARQEYVAASLTQTAGPAMTLGIVGTTITLALPTTYTAPTGADTTFTFEFDTTVRDVTGNYRTGIVLSNSGTLRYTPPGTASGGTRTATPSNVVTTQIVEPVLSVTKTADVGSAPVVGNDVVEYTVALSNLTGAVSPAHETTLIDDVPVDVTPLNAAGNPILDGESTLDGGVWNQTARTLTFSPSATIWPGTTETFVYRVRVNNPAVGGKNLTNTATATTTSIAGTVAGERTIASPRTTGYTATDSNTLNVLTPSVTKSVADVNLTIGQRTTYTVDVTIPANTINYDAIVKDTLPGSLDFDQFISHTCVAGCTPGPTTPTIQPYTPVVNGGAGTVTLAWDLGDLTTQASVTRTFRLVYGVHLRATQRLGGSNVVRPQTAINSVRVMANRTDKVGAFAAGTIPAGVYDDTSAAATRTVTTVEPAFTIDKRIAVNAGAYGNGPVMVRGNDALKYRLTVTNTGNAPAYDVEITDTPNAEIRNLVPAAGTSTTWVSDAWAAPGNDIKWTIPGPIAPGATATVDYTADLPVVTGIRDGDHFDNTAQVTQGWGVPLATRTTDGFVYRSYSSVTDLTRATFDSPSITVDKTTGSGSGPVYPDSATVQVGQAFPWRVRVTNTSTTETATALTVRDVLPPNWAYVTGSASFSPGGAAEPAIVANAGGDQLTWSTAFSLAPGATILLTYQARPSLASATTPGAGVGNPHVNTATAQVRNGVGDPADENGSFLGAANTAQAILSVPLISVAKTPDNAAYTAGETVPFHIVVSNTGTVAATNVVVTDNFPAGLTYVPGAATASPALGFSETSGTPSAATWRIASLAAGTSVDITIPLATDPAAPTGTTITNTASVVSDQTATPTTNTGSVILTPGANLAATKTAAPNPGATAGQTLTYTVGATNSGPSVAQDVVLTDPLPSTVTFVSASPGCTYAAGPRTVTCTFSGPTAVGASRSATITTTVNAGVTTDATNTVTASSATADPVGGNNTATATVPVGARADLVLTKTAAAASIGHGQTTTFDLSYASLGPSSAPSAQIVDTLPAGLTYVSGPAGCTAAGQVVTCTLGTLNFGDTGTRTIVVRGTTTGTYTNTATLSSATTDPVANNTATAGLVVTPAADLGLTKTGPATVVAGGQLTYVLTTTNQGPDPATGVAIIDTLPAGLTFISGDPGCGASGQTVTCPVGNLAMGATATRSILVRAEIAAGGSAVTNNAVARGSETDPNAGNDVASASTQIGPAADVSLTQTAPPTSSAGGNTTFTIVAHNAGPSPATGVTVTSELPEGVTVEQVSSAQGSCTVSGRTVTCVLGNLPNGSSADVTITIAVPAGMAGRSLTNLASVAADQPDPNGSNAAAGTTVQVVTPPAPPAPPVEAPPGEPAQVPAPTGVPTAQLALTKTTDQVARAGERLNYLITATNKGPDVAKDVLVVDALAGDVTFRSAKSSGVKCDYEKGTIRCPIGELKVGDSVRINVAVTPDKAGILVNNAVLSSSTTDLDLTNNRAVALGTVPQQAPTKLSMQKVASAKRVRGGQRLTYTLRVRNTGTAPAINVDVCDQLPAALAFTSTRGGDLKDARLCFRLPTLAPGAKKVYKVRTRVLDRARRGSFTNKATAVADNAARVAGTARALVITDGKVGSEQVRGFTG